MGCNPRGVAKFYGMGYKVRSGKEEFKCQAEPVNPILIADVHNARGEVHISPISNSPYSNKGQLVRDGKPCEAKGLHIAYRKLRVRGNKIGKLMLLHPILHCKERPWPNRETKGEPLKQIQVIREGKRINPLPLNKANH